ncbi:MAG: hypothetical protein J0J01_17230 [Reyranella sp.]|uniref:hypothetical protein n=1 Tax=Reyranella sp. TaxID=1929291 RepID=UPI001AD34FC4|nr:hypothetical protein [Reyranella sp.]MBN9088649.1 hypothetical protein [Reyranella sp.]
MATETRPGGALLAMVLAAALVAVVGLGGLLFGFDQLRAIGSRYMIAVLFVTVWSMVFLAMTIMHAPATPIVASAGLVLWIAYRFCVAVASGGWPLVVDLLGEAILAAGFCGYMLTGTAPAAFYRRRP